MKNLKTLLTMAPFSVSIAILLNVLVYQLFEVINPQTNVDMFGTTSYWSLTNTQALAEFTVLVFLGIFVILMSNRIKNNAVKYGLSYGGIFLLLGSLTRLYEVGSQVFQLVVIAGALIILFLVTYKSTNFVFE